MLSRAAQLLTCFTIFTLFLVSAAGSAAEDLRDRRQGTELLTALAVENDVAVRGNVRKAGVKRMAPGGGEPGGPDGRGAGSEEIFCQELPWLCSEPGGGPWNQSGVDCRWECVTWWSEADERGGSCVWRCAETAEVALSPDTRPEEADAVGPVQGVGPRLMLSTPGRYDTLSGVVTLAGWAMDFVRVESVSFGLDGRPLAVSNLTHGFHNQAACTPPDGNGHGMCNPYSGFSAQLDTRLLPNGTHILEVVAYDHKGWATMIGLRIAIENYGDSEEPTGSASSHANGEVLSGRE